MTRWWRRVAMVAAVVVLAGTSSGAAQGKRPPAAALIAAAKATKLADFEVADELRGLTVQAWMAKLFGAQTPVAWRASNCKAAAGEQQMVNSPICVEARVQLKAGVAFTLGVGFDENVPQPERKPNAIWGSVSVRGKPCEFYRHPDQVHQGRPQLDEMVKAGGRCK
jgi:hypothetical protein